MTTQETLNIAEVALRPKYSKDELVNVIIAKGTAAKQAEGMVNGMLLLVEDAIDSATSLAELEASKAALQAQAQAMYEQILAQLNGGI